LKIQLLHQPVMRSIEMQKAGWRSMHEKAPQVGTAFLADSEQYRLAARRVFAWTKAADVNWQFIVPGGLVQNNIC
jgi:phosphoribosylanthranilate isomerase